MYYLVKTKDERKSVKAYERGLEGSRLFVDDGYLQGGAGSWAGEVMVKGTSCSVLDCLNLLHIIYVTKYNTHS